MNYGVATILHSNNDLKHIYTDIDARKYPLSLLAKVLPDHHPNAVKRLLGRRPNSIPTSNVKHKLTLGIEYAMIRSILKDQSRLLEFTIDINKRFGNWAVHAGAVDAHAVYAFNSAAVEIFRAAKRNRTKCVLEQTIAPRRYEEAIIQEASVAFPSWTSNGTSAKQIESFARREQEEWDLADTILCASNFVVEGIASCGGPVEKCIVVPYGVDIPFEAFKDRSDQIFPRERPLRVLTIGAVGLRKGTPYTLDAAKQLEGIADFRLVGPITCTSESLSDTPPNVNILGICPRSEIAKHYEWADVFLLPSLCEGSATVTYEAALMGVPIICTRNTGSTIISEEDGLIIEEMSATSIINSIRKLFDSPSLYENLVAGTRKRNVLRRFQAYRDRLIAALQENHA